MTVLQRIAQNQAGTDYVCGDIHGMHDFLLAALDAIAFDKNRDRLLCAGDLIDRGPHNQQVIDLLDEPWFFSVMGNHDRNLALYANDEPLEINLEPWFLVLSEKERKRIGKRLAELPLAIELETADGVAGIVHAEVPEGLSWRQFVAGLASRDGAMNALWGDALFYGVTQHGHQPRPVPGIERVFHGHRRPANRQAFAAGNRHWLDTGAFEIHTRRMKPYKPYVPGLTFADADTARYRFVSEKLTKRMA